MSTTFDLTPRHHSFVNTTTNTNTTNANDVSSNSKSSSPQRSPLKVAYSPSSSNSSLNMTYASLSQHNNNNNNAPCSSLCSTTSSSSAYIDPTISSSSLSSNCDSLHQGILSLRLAGQSQINRVPRISSSITSHSLADQSFRSRNSISPLQTKNLKHFNSRSQYIEAMKEDLAEWLNRLYDDIELTPANFFQQLETGSILCRHANYVTHMARQFLSKRKQNFNHSIDNNISHNDIKIPTKNFLSFRADARAGTFFARDNICQFIMWCRSLNIIDCLLFETDDLVARKNLRSFILCMLEVARIGFKVGVPTPLIIQLEQEIDHEIEMDAKIQEQLAMQAQQKCDLFLTTSNEVEAEAKEEVEEEEEELKNHDKKQDLTEEDDFGHKPQVITNDLMSLHEKVVQLLSQCTCPTQFPMVRVGDNGKYKVGDKLIIFVRILRRHIMVRVGGGWQELSEFLRAKDPCRMRCQISNGFNSPGTFSKRNTAQSPSS